MHTMLGVHACTLIHCKFQIVDGKRVCWLVVEQTATPIYVQDGKIARYFVRTGNATTELDARDAHEHVARKEWSAAPS